MADALSISNSKPPVRTGSKHKNYGSIILEHPVCYEWSVNSNKSEITEPLNGTIYFQNVEVNM
jgi:hypothetical protein